MILPHPLHHPPYSQQFIGGRQFIILAHFRFSVFLSYCVSVLLSDCLFVILSFFLCLSWFKFSSSQFSLVHCNSPVSCLSPFYCLTVFLSFYHVSYCLSSYLFTFSSSKVINSHIVPSVTMESKKCETDGMVIISHRSSKSIYGANK